jgi:hypothetical protein
MEKYEMFHQIWRAGQDNGATPYVVEITIGRGRCAIAINSAARRV